MIESLLKELTGQLQILCIPSESSHLSFFASTTWPELRELAFQGGVPRVDASLAHVMSAMPKLHVLTLLRFSQTPWVVWPPDLPSASPLPALERFTISDINPGDCAVLHLSASLTELSLRDVPRYYRRRHKEPPHAVALLTARGAFAVMRTVHGRMLRRLEIVFREDEHELDLITLIAHSCPDLSFLELHRYAHDDSAFKWREPAAISIPMGHVADALSSLNQLRTLRLNFDLGIFVTDYAFEDDFPNLTASRWRPFLEAHARHLANSLPWLNTVAFLTVEASGLVAWNTWYVAGMPDLQTKWEVDEYLMDS